TRSKRAWSSDVCSSDLATGTTFSIDGWAMEERVGAISTWNVTARVEPHEVANVIAAIGEHNATFLSHAHPNFERFNALMDKYNKIGRAACREGVKSHGV